MTSILKNIKKIMEIEKISKRNIQERYYTKKKMGCKFAYLIYFQIT